MQDETKARPRVLHALFGTQSSAILTSGIGALMASPIVQQRFGIWLSGETVHFATLLRILGVATIAAAGLVMASGRTGPEHADLVRSPAIGRSIGLALLAYVAYAVLADPSWPAGRPPDPSSRSVGQDVIRRVEATDRAVTKRKTDRVGEIEWRSPRRIETIVEEQPGMRMGRGSADYSSHLSTSRQGPGSKVEDIVESAAIPRASAGRGEALSGGEGPMDVP